MDETVLEVERLLTLDLARLYGGLANSSGALGSHEDNDEGRENFGRELFRDEWAKIRDKFCASSLCKRLIMQDDKRALRELVVCIADMAVMAVVLIPIPRLITIAIKEGYEGLCVD